MRFLRGMSILALAVVSLAAYSQKPETMQAPTAWEKTARLVGILPEVQRLREVSSSAAPVDRWELLWLHQRISEQVMAASLQVDATIAQIDNEISRSNEVRSYLSDRRDLTVNRADLIGIIVGGGLGAAGSAMQFSSPSLAKTGNALSLGGGLSSVGLGLFGLHAQSGKSSRFEFASNMLAEFFDRPELPDSRYPATIWTFLGENSPNGPSGVSRREQLLQGWVEVRRINSPANKDKIDRLTSEPSQMVKLSIDDFEDRAAMLQDVRARVSFLKRDLGQLLASLPDASKLSESDLKPVP